MIYSSVDKAEFSAYSLSHDPFSNMLICCSRNISDISVFQQTVDA